MNLRNLLVDSNPPQSRLRITIPREPELETAQRAERQKAHRLRSGAKQSQEGTAPAVQTFKARPLNRKILKAPSLPLRLKSTPRLPQFQPFHLKTDERALQYSATSSSSGVTKNPFSVSTVQAGAPGLKKLQCQPSVSSVPQNVEQKGEGCDIVQIKFKAQPLNKKLLSSKGDIGVFQSTKRETTKPMEFNFSTSKRCQQDPPIELFNRLSLNTDINPASSHAMLPCPSHGVNKDWKENINCTLQQAQKELRSKQLAFGDDNQAFIALELQPKLWLSMMQTELSHTLMSQIIVSRKSHTFGDLYGFHFLPWLHSRAFGIATLPFFRRGFPASVEACKFKELERPRSLKC